MSVCWFLYLSVYMSVIYLYIHVSLTFLFCFPVCLSRCQNICFKRAHTHMHINHSKHYVAQTLARLQKPNTQQIFDSLGFILCYSKILFRDCWFNFNNFIQRYEELEREHNILVLELKSLQMEKASLSSQIVNHLCHGCPLDRRDEDLKKIQTSRLTRTTTC